MKGQKISFGIRLKKEIVEKIDKIIKEIYQLKTTRSELIEAVIEAFFSSHFDSIEKSKEFIITKRKRESNK